MSTDDVTAIIAAIPPRRHTLLPESITGVFGQQYPVSALSVAMDWAHEGAGPTRMRALAGVRTEWVATCDDDDVWYPQHIRVLLEKAVADDLDYVFSYWDLSKFGDVLRHWGKVFDPANPTHTTSVVLVRTELAQEVGYRPPQEGCAVSNEDWFFTEGCLAAGAKIGNVIEQTWWWRVDGQNTSGRGENWL